MRALVAYALFLPFGHGLCLVQQKAAPALPSSAAASTVATRRLPAGGSVLSSPLQVTHVSLYKNGVGFFEHAGTVTGDASVGLDLSSAQLNDLLQTLTVADLGGGRVTGLNYNSTTPLEQQLQTLPLNLGEQPSEDDLFRTLRGARVEVRGAGAPFTGRLLSIEVRPAVAAGDAATKPGPQRRIITVVSGAGAARSLELGGSTVVQVLEAGLRSDLNTYLQLLDRNRTEGVRHMVLRDQGEGTRELRVSYLSEVPVWKSTYRVLLVAGPNGTEGTATLQGFSVVDNTTGEDWNNVQLSLLAGSPQSFLQPISQPIYDRRPEIPIAENAQTMPQTHEAAEGVAPPPPGSASADLGSGSVGTPSSLFGSPTGTGSGTEGPVVASARIPKNINMMKDTGPPPPPITGPFALAAAPEVMDQAMRQTTEVNATTSAFDDFFAYNLTDPVTIPRNGSALVPILQQRLPVESVSLWSQGAGGPLRALWVTNSSHLTLDSGSFTVVENGAFAGQGLVDPVHPGERRLLSYARDQAVRVTPESEQESRRILHVSITRGVLRAQNTEVIEARYTVSDAAPEARTVLLEIPRRAGWTLDPEARPAETTPGLYRFRVPVAAHGSARVTATQRHVLEDAFALADTTEQQLTLYLRGYGADPRILAALEPVFAARQQQNNLETHIGELKARMAALGVDQKRLRDNLQALKGSSDERALARRYTGELNSQEDALATLTHELDTLQAQRSATAAQLSRLIEDLQIA